MSQNISELNLAPISDENWSILSTNNYLLQFLR